MRCVSNLRCIAFCPIIALAFLASCKQRPVEGGDGRGLPVFTDHHVHLMSPQLVREWKSLGVPFSKPDSAYVLASAVLSRQTELPIDSGRVQRAVLLPMAHLYGRESFREALNLSESEELERVRNENNYVVHHATLFSGSAVAFCGVDFLRPYAMDEIRRCLDDLKVKGIKLHLASAGADLRDPAYLGLLASIFRLAESEGIVLAVHFDPQARGLEIEDVEQFIDTVLAPHPNLTVVIAHVGGSGGYGSWVQSVFETFGNWLKEEEELGNTRSGVYFDLSAVWLERESEGIPASTQAQGRALGSDLRLVGFERIVFGSDYPVFNPNNYARVLRTAIDLGPDEWEQVMQNTVGKLWVEASSGN